MFTRAVISDEISQDLELAARMARDFGLDQLEIRTAWDVRIDNMNAQELERVKRIASEHGLSIVCLASPFFKAELGSDAEYQEHIALLRRAIAAAHTLGATIIRTFTFWKKGEIGPVFDRIVQAYAEPARIAAGEGITLGIENEPACFAGTGKETAEVLEAIGSPAVKAVWDPGNAYWTGNERAVPDGYERIKPHIAHVHLKDVITRGGEKHATVLGDGEVDIPRQLALLVQDGYSDCASLETHYRVKAHLSEEAVNRPGGSAFSEGGEEASRLCLEAWNGMMKKLPAGAAPSAR
ncbi:MAG TPA: sugar phosphate isomerase/epimerase family protein [Chloroflexota bacterium]|nr:sugar phosphate isomerase/epimerase family protein [Chloroflexota bacterium]